MDHRCLINDPQTENRVMTRNPKRPSTMRARPLKLLVLLFLVLCFGQARAADVYDCQVVEALYLTPAGYKPHFGDTAAYVSQHVIIDKDTGAVTGPMYSNSLQWIHVGMVSRYTFMTAGYAIDRTLVFDVVVQKQMEGTFFVSLDLLTLTMMNGICK